MTVSISGTGGITFNDNSVQDTAATGFGFKNRIINGAMVIDQRNAGASVTISANAYVLDRWRAIQSQSSKYSVQQNAGAVTPPTGFSNYLGVTSLSAYSVSATDNFNIIQRIEGFNTADLAWGTANAVTVTLSFWVRSSLTGTFGGALANSAQNRSYPFSYAISSANTWEQKTVTIAGDTTGTWIGATNGIGIQVIFGLGVGSTYSGTAGAWAGTEYDSATGAVSVVGTNGATFYITGVQLEKGSTATSFDYRPYGTELQLCLRYAQVYGSGVAYERLGGGLGVGTLAVNFTFPLNVTMRASPSVSSTGSYGVYNGTTLTAGTTFSIDATSISVLAILLATTGVAAGGAYQVLNNNSPTSRFTLSAEL
jgi:hypothetical protein